jgi:hypothetical protein
MKARIAVEDRPPARDEFVRTTILPLVIVAIVGIFLVTICSRPSRVKADFRRRINA